MQKSEMLMSGFIAQEVEAAAQEIGYEFSGIDAPRNANDFYGLRYAEFVVPLVKAMQEQQIQIENLKQENASILETFDHRLREQNEQITKLQTMIIELNAESKK